MIFRRIMMAYIKFPSPRHHLMRDADACLAVSQQNFITADAWWDAAQCTILQIFDDAVMLKVCWKLSPRRCRNAPPCSYQFYFKMPAHLLG